MKKTPDIRILVFSSDKISDPAIDLAGLLKNHYCPCVSIISVPCSSSVKLRWIMRAFDKGFNGVFIAADGSDCPYSDSCTERTSNIVSQAHELMKKKKMDTARLRMAAICSVCSDPFVRQMNSFSEYLSK
jgi:F420-non-reducing hydrogenase iron-sulfur subunit